MYSQNHFSPSDFTPVESVAPGFYLHDRPESGSRFPPYEHPQEQEAFLLPDGSVCYGFPLEQPRMLDMPPMPEPSRFYVNYPNSSAAFGFEDGMGSTANYYARPLEHPCLADVGYVFPAQPIPPMVSARATGVNIPVEYPSVAQEYLGQFDNDTSAVPTSGTSMGSLSSANSASSPSEVSQVHSSPAQLPGSSSSVPRQTTSQSSGDLRQCEWIVDHERICGELVGWECQHHLASAHGIRKISAHEIIVCGACGRKEKRKFFVRHFREVHLHFRRQRQNAA
ncbi:hypothetical protein EDD15DRAFT_2367678 [Pisolithus albus]|nr:hypothetical protein EDD15DRAFT_2367678 [Pisolithus albus]